MAGIAVSHAPHKAAESGGFVGGGSAMGASVLEGGFIV